MKVKMLWRVLPLLLCMCFLSSCFDGVETTVTPNEQSASATSFGIGYGYDVLNSPYFESGQVKKRNSILNLDEAGKLIEKTQQSSSTSGSVHGKSIEEYAKDYQKRVGMGVEASSEFAVYSVSVGLSFNVNGSGFFEQKVSKNEQQMFYTYFDDINTYYLEMKNYNLDTLKGMLSDFFIKDVNRESSDTKGMTDKELAEYLMATYGTHLITGVQMGGRMEFSYVISTSDSEVYQQLDTALDIQFKGGVGKMFGLGVEGSEQEKVEELLGSENVRSEATIRRFGGMSTGLWTYEELQANYKEWANSLNEEKYQNAVGIAPDGMVALWNLIPAGNDGLVAAMQAIYRQNGLDAYNTNLEGLRPTVQGPVEEIDLTPYYDMSSGADTVTLDERFKNPNYDPETGVFTAYGRINGTDIERYVFKGMFTQLDNDGVVVTQKIAGFSICVQSEHDIEIVLENVGYEAATGHSALYDSDSIKNQNMVVTLVASGEASHDPQKKQNVIEGNSDGATVNVTNLIITGEDDLEIRGGHGKDAVAAGGHGGHGQAAISGNQVTINLNASLTAIGGNGGNGQDGVKGADGISYGDGGGSNPADGGRGENGQNGGNGGCGGMAIEAESIVVEGGVANLYGGNSGIAGNGGRGGNGGKGQDTATLNATSGNGGDGGNGGKGGDAYKGANATKVDVTVCEGATLNAEAGEDGSWGWGALPGQGGYAGDDNWWSSKGENGDPGKPGSAGSIISDIT